MKVNNKAVLAQYSVEVDLKVFKFIDLFTKEQFEFQWSHLLERILGTPFFPNSCQILVELRRDPRQTVQECILKTFNFRGLSISLLESGHFVYETLPKVKIYDYHLWDSVRGGYFNLQLFQEFLFLLSFCSNEEQALINLINKVVIINDKYFIRGKFSFDSDLNNLIFVDETRSINPITATTPGLDLEFELVPEVIVSHDNYFDVLSEDLKKYIKTASEKQIEKLRVKQDKLEQCYMQSVISNPDLPKVHPSSYDEETEVELVPYNHRLFAYAA